MYTRCTTQDLLTQPRSKDLSLSALKSERREGEGRGEKHPGNEVASSSGKQLETRATYTPTLPRAGRVGLYCSIVTDDSGELACGILACHKITRESE